MHNKPKLVINSVYNTGILEIYVDETLLTTYEYLDGFVTLSENKEQIIDIDILNGIVNDISIWITLISSELSIPVNQQISPFSEEMKKENGKIECKKFISDILIVESEYNHANGEIKFSPRDEIVISFIDFITYFNFLTRYNKEIFDF